MTDSLLDTVSDAAMMQFYAEQTALLETATTISKVRGKKGLAPTQRLVDTFKANCDKQIDGSATKSWVEIDTSGVYWLAPKINNVPLARGFLKIGPVRENTKDKIRAMKIAADYSPMFRKAIVETARENVETRKQPRETRDQSGKPTMRLEQLMVIPAQPAAEIEAETGGGGDVNDDTVA